MKKKKMEDTIRQKTIEAYVLLKLYESALGRDHEISEDALLVWRTLNDLCDELGIEYSNSL